MGRAWAYLEDGTLWRLTVCDVTCHREVASFQQEFQGGPRHCIFRSILVLSVITVISETNKYFSLGVVRISKITMSRKKKFSTQEVLHMVHEGKRLHLTDFAMSDSVKIPAV